MQYPSRLLTGRGLGPDQSFDAVAYMADRIHQLRDSRPIQVVPCLCVTPEFQGSALRITFEDTGDLLGVAIIGKPELAPDRQEALLVGALQRLDPARVLAW